MEEGDAEEGETGCRTGQDHHSVRTELSVGKGRRQEMSEGVKERQRGFRGKIGRVEGRA